MYSASAEQGSAKPLTAHVNTEYSVPSILGTVILQRGYVYRLSWYCETILVTPGAVLVTLITYLRKFTVIPAETMELCQPILITSDGQPTNGNLLEDS